jgi:hypothetical protein
MAVDADKVVLTSALVTLGSTVTASAAPEKLGGKGELPHPRLLIGGGLTFFGLSILADFAPAIAKPMAVAIAVTALTYYGMPVVNKVFTDKEK